MRPDPTPDTSVSVVGGINFPLLAIIIAAILMSATVDLGRIAVAGVEVELANALRKLQAGSQRVPLAPPTVV